MDKVNYFLSAEYEPWFNLAVEDWIFTKMDPSVPTLYLWRNSDTVVIGRYQNPWLECDLEAMKRDEVYLARRQSGGGAVYHDLNNTNFTFLADPSLYDPALGFSLITRALEQFGVHAAVSGRNDMVIPPSEKSGGIERKFSGSAFRKLSDRVFHHGTLLINADMTRLSRYLTPREKKLEAKGVKSVRSRVINLAELNPEINHDTLCGAIREKFFDHYDLRADPVILDRNSLEEREDFLPLYEKLKSEEWLYGMTPPFTQRIEGRTDLGMMEFLFNVKGGIIKECTLYSDSLYSQIVKTLNKVFDGACYSADGIEERMAVVIREFPDKKVLLTDLRRFIIDNIT